MFRQGSLTELQVNQTIEPNGFARIIRNDGSWVSGYHRCSKRYGEWMFCNERGEVIDMREYDEDGGWRPVLNS